MCERLELNPVKISGQNAQHVNQKEQHAQDSAWMWWLLEGDVATGGRLLGASGAISPEARPAGLGTGFKRGPSRLVILLLGLHGKSCGGQQASTHHRSSHCLGTIPKGQSGHSKTHDQKGGLNSVPAAGPPRYLCSDCAPAAWSPTLLTATSAAAPVGWEWGKSESAGGGPGEAASPSMSTLQTRAGSWGNQLTWGCRSHLWHLREGDVRYHDL